MECKYCQTKMVHMDDSGSLTNKLQSWNYYVCPSCKADVNVTVNDAKESRVWDKHPALTEHELKRLNAK